MKDNEHISKAEAAGLAARQHVPVREFLNQESIRKDLLLGLGESNELTLLKELLKKKRPVTSKYMKDMYDIGTEVVSRAARHVIRYLENFSERFGTLNANNIVMSIHRRIGGNQVGYYFACLNTETDEYLDGTETKNLLDNLWQYEIEIELRKRLKEEAKMFLSEKLHGENDYLPIEIEIGTVDESQEEDSIRNWSCLDLSNAQDLGRIWIESDTECLIDPKGYHILISETGTGKTTFLRHLQMSILDKKSRIPLFFHASEIENWRFRNIREFIELIAEEMNLEWPKEKVVRFLADASGDKVLLLIDGLDQIGGAGTKYEHIVDRLLRIWKDMIIASRPSAVMKYGGRSDITFLRLRPLSLSAQKNYYGEYYNRALRICRDDQSMLAVPMLGYMIRLLVTHGKDKQIENRASLYRRFIDYILHDYEHEESTLVEEERLLVRTSLQEIAYKALANHHPFVQIVPLMYCFEFTSRKIDIDRFPKYGLTNLIVDRSKGAEKHLYFSHQSFQEYLAAEWAVRSEDRISYLIRNFWDPKWREVIKFAVGLRGDDSLIKLIYPGPQYDNEIRMRLFMAAECATEVPLCKQLQQLLIEDLISAAKVTPLKGEAFDSLVKLGTNTTQDLAWNIAMSAETTIFGKKGFFAPGFLTFERLYSEERLEWLLEQPRINEHGLGDNRLICIVHNWIRCLKEESADRIIERQLNATKIRPWLLHSSLELSAHVKQRHEKRILEKLEDKDEYLRIRGLEDILYLGIKPRDEVRSRIITLLNDERVHVAILASYVAATRIDNLSPKQIRQLLAAYISGKTNGVHGCLSSFISKALREKMAREDIQYLIRQIGKGHWSKGARVLDLINNLEPRLDMKQLRIIYEYIRQEPLAAQAIKTVANYYNVLESKQIQELLDGISHEDRDISAASMFSVLRLHPYVDNHYIFAIFRQLNEANKYIANNSDVRDASWSTMRFSAIHALSYLLDRLEKKQISRLVRGLNVSTSSQATKSRKCLSRIRSYMSHADKEYVTRQLTSRMLSSETIRMYIELLGSEYIGARLAKYMTGYLNRGKLNLRNEVYFMLKQYHERFGP